MIPRWFDVLVHEEIARLYSLNLEGCPAADIVEATARGWVDDLWKALQHAELTLVEDEGRLRQAFHRVRLTTTRWPPLALYLRELRPREAKRQARLPAPAIDAAELERRRAVLERACAKDGLIAKGHLFNRRHTDAR